MKLINVVLLSGSLVAPVTMTTSAANRPLQAAQSPTISAKLTMADGATRLVELDGVGCAVSICSRTQIKGHARGASLDSFAFDAIQTIESATQDKVLLVMKDGTRRMLSLDNNFRVLYFHSESGSERQLDLSKMKSLEFVEKQ